MRVRCLTRRIILGNRSVDKLQREREREKGNSSSLSLSLRVRCKQRVSERELRKGREMERREARVGAGRFRAAYHATYILLCNRGAIQYEHNYVRAVYSIMLIAPCYAKRGDRDGFAKLRPKPITVC